MLGVGLDLGQAGLRGHGAKTGGAVVPPPTDPVAPDLPADPVAPDLPVAPAVRWHPHYAATVLDAGRVASATDLQGLADVSAIGTGAGPLALADGQTRTFWRFEGAQALEVAGALVCGSRDMSAFLVARVPRHPASYNRYLSLGSRARGTQVNTLGGPLESRVVSQSAGHVQGFGKLAYTASSGSEWLVPGAQKQVIGMTSGEAGIRLFLNERFVDVAKAYSISDVSGGEIGRYSWSPGSAGTWGVFDLYEMVVYDRALNAAEAQSVTEALMAGHDIVPVAHQLILEGDSIAQGTGDVTPALSGAAVLTEPGTHHLPPDWRVINKGVSGNKVADLVTRRDTSRGWATQRLQGQNVVAFEIGRNDWASGITQAQHYANVVNYLSAPGVGVLHRGWTVRAMANIAAAPGLMTQVQIHRDALRDPQFLVDTGSHASGAFAGRVNVVSTDLIEHDGQTRFLEPDDAADATYYVGDNTHPTILGARIRVTGGDTPQYGVAAGL